MEVSDGHTTKVLKVLKVLEHEKQLEDRKEQGIDDAVDKVVNYSSYATNLSSTLPNYIYTKEDIDKFFSSNNGQEEKRTLEDSICRPFTLKSLLKGQFFIYIYLILSAIETSNDIVHSLVDY